MGKLIIKLKDPHLMNRKKGHMGMCTTLISSFSRDFDLTESLLRDPSITVEVQIYPDGIQGNSHLYDLYFGFPLTMQGLIRRTIMRESSVVADWNATIYGTRGSIGTIILSIPTTKSDFTYEEPMTGEEMVRELTKKVVELLKGV